MAAWVVLAGEVVVPLAADLVEPELGLELEAELESVIVAACRIVAAAREPVRALVVE